MSQSIRQPTLTPGQHLVLDDVDWRTYSQFLRIFSERPHIRLTYDRGRLEIMSPLLEHDWDTRFLGRLVVAVSEEIQVDIVSGGSTTLRRQLRRRGIEADECYWIASAARIYGR